MIKLTRSAGRRSLALFLLLSLGSLGSLGSGVARADQPQGQAQRRVALTDKEQAALDKGPIPTAAWVTGGVIGTAVIPFGVGQAIEGRYGETGWIFTVGELSSLGILIGGATASTFSCSSTGLYSTGIYCTTSISPLFWVGLGALAGFRIWEVIDVWVAPASRNAAYRRALKKTGGQDRAWLPIVAPTDSRSLALGLQLRF